MKNKIWIFGNRKPLKRVAAVMLTAVLLAGCGNTAQTKEAEESQLSGEASADPADSGAETASENASVQAELSGEDPAEAAISHAPAWAADAVLYEVNLRQYTKEGTFEAFGEQLETLQEMGINPLWFMPIHPIGKINRISTLGSYYSVADYTDVNPEYGTKEDFAALVSKAHDMGFHVILDWVANHTAWDNPWISEHPDWYTQKDGKIISPEGTGWNDVADLNYDNEAMRQEMIASMAYWVENFDIDGFRCDYAPGVPVDFWEEARQTLSEEKDLLFIAEDLGWVNEKLLNYAFDGNYNSKVYEALVAVSHDNKSADKLKLYMPRLAEDNFVMNYLDNHDVNSYDRTIYEAFGEGQMHSMLAYIFTAPGMPMIYSGDEIGYNKRIEFMDKDTIDWENGTGDYRELIRLLADLKKEHPALYTGEYGGTYEEPETEGRQVLTFTRTRGEETILCIFNFSKRPKEDYHLDMDLTGATLLLKGDAETYELGENIGNEKAGTEEAGNGEEDGTFVLPEHLEPWAFYIIKL
ncbi:MAG: alpha amylase C-terminal domain-containing protein [Lachnospiraceae bacterium]|nr:alpha amylase C-terminal domain-containing protein [Lachnospiraceae bacterium]